MILEVKHVNKYFGAKKILTDINFTIDAGECLGIVGLSDGGQIILCGEELLRAAGL